jgi:hypothetical protein
MLMSLIITGSIKHCVNYKINHNAEDCFKTKTMIRNYYLRNLLSYQTQKMKQRINIMKKYLLRNYDVSVYELEDNAKEINKQICSNYYTISFKYYNLSYYEHELIEFIMNCVI